MRRTVVQLLVIVAAALAGAGWGARLLGDVQAAVPLPGVAGGRPPGIRDVEQYKTAGGTWAMALQAAIDAGPGLVRLPPSVIDLGTATISIRNSYVILEGAGQGISVLQYRGDGTALECVAQTRPDGKKGLLAGVWLRGFTLIGVAGKSRVGIALDRVVATAGSEELARSGIEKVTVDRFKTGIVADNLWDGTLSDCFVEGRRGAGTTGFLLRNANGVAVRDCFAHQCETGLFATVDDEGHGPDALLISGGTYHGGVNPDGSFWYCDSAIKIGECDAGGGVTITGVYIERAATGIEIAGSSRHPAKNVSIRGAYLTGLKSSKGKAFGVSCVNAENVDISQSHLATSDGDLVYASPTCFRVEVGANTYQGSGGIRDEQPEPSRRPTMTVSARRQWVRRNLLKGSLGETVVPLPKADQRERRRALRAELEVSLTPASRPTGGRLVLQVYPKGQPDAGETMLLSREGAAVGEAQRRRFWLDLGASDEVAYRVTAEGDWAYDLAIDRTAVMY